MWIPLILVGIILGVVLLRKYNVKMPVIAVSMPPVSGRVIAWVLGSIVALVAAVWLYSTDSFSGLGGVDVSLWIAIIILLILAGRALILHVSTKRAETAALVIVVGGLLFFGTDAPKVWKKVQGGVSSVVLSESKSAKREDTSSDKPLETLPQGRVWETKSYVWDERNPDGTIPIFTQSNSVELNHRGCKVMFSDRGGREYGKDYAVLYLNNNGEWVPHIAGDNSSAYEVRAIALKTNMKELTYRLSCP